MSPNNGVVEFRRLNSQNPGPEELSKSGLWRRAEVG